MLDERFNITPRWPTVLFFYLWLETTMISSVLQIFYSLQLSPITNCNSYHTVQPIFCVIYSMIKYRTFTNPFLLQNNSSSFKSLFYKEQKDSNGWILWNNSIMDAFRNGNVSNFAVLINFICLPVAVTFTFHYIYTATESAAGLEFT